jgi:hypothetical protein
VTPLPEQSYREIKLTQGQVALVSPHRYEEINSFKWYAFWNKLGNCFYAARVVKYSDGKRRIMFMHRQIKGLQDGDPREADHEDHLRTLDNTDDNLRIVDKWQQAQHRRKRRDNTSGYKGVQLCNGGRWRATITVRGRRIHLGYFSTAKAAYAAYCQAAMEYHGEYACLG